MKYSYFIEIGYYRSDISQKISNLMSQGSFRYHIYDRINELGKFNDKTHLKESRDDFTKIIIGAVKQINESIDSYNESALDVFGSKIKRIPMSPVRIEINRIFKHLETDNKGYDLVAPFIEKNFHEFLFKTVDPVFLDLIKHKNDYGDFIKSFNLKSYDEIYRPDLHQMLDVYLMGYKSTALLILGRVFEKQFTIWGLTLIDNKQLDKTKDEFSQLKLENILGIFRTKKWITEKEWLVLSKLRLDRNIGGHYLSEKDALLRKEAEQEAEMTIRLSIPLLKKIHTKLNKGKSRP